MSIDKKFIDQFVNITSKAAIAGAVDTFSEDRTPWSGMWTNSSQRSLVNLDKPRPSEPKINAIGWSAIFRS